MVGRPQAHAKVSWFIKLAHQFPCVLSFINLGLVHSPKDTKFETIVRIEITQKIPHSSPLFKLKLLKYVGSFCIFCVFQKFMSIIGFNDTVQT